MNIAGKVAVVTGAAHGLGKAYSRELLRRGAKVLVVDLDQAAGEATEKEFQETFGADAVKFVKCDVTNEDDLKAVFAAATHALGGLHILVNNAGIGESLGAEKCFQVNVFALKKSTEMAVAHMRSDEGGEGGVIVNISSIAALVTLPLGQIYAPSKAAALSYSAGYARLLGEDIGVRIGVLCPGFVLTDLTEGMKRMEDEKKPLPTEQLRLAGGWTPMNMVVDACMAIIEKPLPQGTVVRACADGPVVVKIGETPVEPLV